MERNSELWYLRLYGDPKGSTINKGDRRPKRDHAILAKVASGPTKGCFFEDG